MSGTPQNALANGSTVGRYKIIRFLGAGAMGEVYLAEDPQIERPLAIKTVRLVGRDTEVEDRKKRLLREARAAGKMLHPHIVTLFDVGEAEGLLYLAFEYVEGTDLAGRLEAGPPLQVAEVLRFARQSAEALAYAHEHGIVHRDVKPSNILIDKAGRVKVADFGIAKMAGQNTELTMAGSVMGSPQYLSPEQIRGEDLDGRSDVFSLGVVLYELLSGKRPFDGETLTTLVYKILHQEPPPVSALRAVPERLEALLVRMLEKDRDQRIGSIAQVAAELAAIERELPDETLSAQVTPFGVSVRPGAGPTARATAPMTQPAPGLAGAGTMPAPSLPPLPSAQTAPSAPTLATRAPVASPPPPPGAATPATPRHAAAMPMPAPASTSSNLPALIVIGVAGLIVLIAAALAWRYFTKGDKPFVPQVGIPATADGPTATDGTPNATTEPGTTPPGSPGAPPVGTPQGTISGTGEPNQQLVYPQIPGSPIDGRMVRQDPPASLDRRQPVPTPRPADSRPADSRPVESRPVATPPVATPQPTPPAVAPPAAEPQEAPRASSGDRIETGLSLAFRVSPPDAFVLFDGTVIGKASEFNGLKGSRVFEVDPGEHTIKFRKGGMEDLVVEIDATGAGTSVIGGRLKSLSARASTSDLLLYQVQEGIGLRITPPLAQVTVDGTPARLVPGAFGRRGAGYLPLGPGTHRIAVFAPGFERQEFAVEVTPAAEEERRRIDVVLVRDR